MKWDWKLIIEILLKVLPFFLAITAANYVAQLPGCKLTPPPPNGGGQTPPNKQAVEAIGKIRMSGGACSGTLIGPPIKGGYYTVVSAAHCFGRVGEVATYYVRKTNTPIKIEVMAIDRTQDIAICRTQTPHDGLPWVLVAEKSPVLGTKIWHSGFGVDKPGNLEVGEVTGKSANGQLRYSLSVSPGDSGGGICVDRDGKLLSPVCCTSCLGCRGSVYGGSPERIHQMVSTPTAFWDDIQPVKMPDPPAT